MTRESNIYKCIQYNSRNYKRSKTMQIKGVMLHSTGANNPNLKRYVQPYESDTNYQDAIAMLGYNKNHNDWNHKQVSKGVNAFIGKFASGTVGVVQTLPWDMRPWGCGAGRKGSANNGWIQIEICEDGLNDKQYALSCWYEARALIVFLCKEYGLNPSLMATCDRAIIPQITCHHEAHLFGVASGHKDIDHWFPKILNKNMDNMRSEVYSILLKEGFS